MGSFDESYHPHLIKRPLEAAPIIPLLMPFSPLEWLENYLYLISFGKN